MIGATGHHGEAGPFTQCSNGTPLFSLFKIKKHSARTKSQKLCICVEPNGCHTFADAELKSELAKTNFSGQAAPGASGASLLHMKIYPAYVQRPRKQLRHQTEIEAVFIQQSGHKWDTYAQYQASGSPRWVHLLPLPPRTCLLFYPRRSLTRFANTLSHALKALKSGRSLINESPRV